LPQLSWTFSVPSAPGTSSSRAQRIFAAILGQDVGLKRDPVVHPIEQRRFQCVVFERHDA